MGMDNGVSGNYLPKHMVCFCLEQRFGTELFGAKHYTLKVLLTNRKEMCIIHFSFYLFVNPSPLGRMKLCTMRSTEFNIFV